MKEMDNWYMERDIDEELVQAIHLGASLTEIRAILQRGANMNACDTGGEGSIGTVLMHALMAAVSA